MIADIKSTGSCYKRTGKVYWPLFRREVKVSFGMNADVSTEYAEKCVSQLLDLDHSGVEQLLQASVRFFYDAERCYAEPLPFQIGRASCREYGVPKGTECTNEHFALYHTGRNVR